jgi:nucleoside-diphosphate-sugar epimerase
VVNDEPNKLSPTKHEDYFSNYAVSKHEADKYVCAAHRSEGKQGRTLLTGCLRPGNGVFGPGGDTLLDQYARMKNGPTWIEHILSSFIYVENCSIAHLAFERTLLNSPQSPAGGQSYCICDHGDPPTYGEAYRALSIFSVPDAVKFHSLSPTLMLLISYIVQALYLARQFIPYPFKYIFPSLEAGNIKFLQPAMFDLTLVHLIFDDSRARKELGYRSAWDTRGGIWETARGRVEKKKGFVVVGGPMDGIGTPTEKENAIAREGGSGGGVGVARPQLAAEEVLGKAVRQVLESQGKS